MTDANAQKALWDVRKAGLNIMMSMKGDGKPVSFIEDCAVPLEHLAEYVDRLTQVFARHGTRGTWYAHASVGTLHVRPILDMRRDGAAKMRAIAEEASAMVREYKGAFSGEHGDGLVRSEWVGWQFGPRLSRAFEEIKDLFDPAGLMNPGKIVRGTKMDDASLFRFPPGYRIQAVRPALDWTAWNVQNDAVTGTLSPAGSGGDPAAGLAKAVEMCNNNGHCRKFDAGTMCPSYRATRDEAHLTRGRANTLRQALSGKFGADGLASDAVFDALDLCVSCKGCRRECPTGVDMAKMKIEALHRRQAARGLPFRERLIAQLPRWAPWAARMSWIANLRNQLPGMASLTESWLGFSARRSLPAWRGDPFLRGLRTPGGDADKDADVVLFVDTFSNYFEAENARAAMNVLRAAGYRVHAAQPQSTDAEPSRPLCLRAHVSRRGSRRRSEGRGSPCCRGAQAACRPRRSRRRPRAFVPPLDARRVPGDGPGRGRGTPRGTGLSDRGVPGARARRAAPGAAPLRAPAERSAAARALPSEGVRCGRGDAGGPRPRARASRSTGRIELLRHGGQLRLRCRTL
jgi:ferredoxin